MNENIIVNKQAFGLNFCNQCLEIAANEFGLVGDGARDSDVRNSKITFLHGALNHLDIYTEILKFISEVNKHHFDFQLDGIESPQLTEYDSLYQGEYKPHKDSFQNEQGITRKLSMVVQITPPDSYEGGLLQFPDIKGYDSSLTMEQGTAIVFPSYLLHGVTPVTSGKRKSLVVWANGQPFR